jgi:hypothetical protein
MTQTPIKTVNIRGKSYVEVAERVRLVHDQKREFELMESEPYAVADRWIWRVSILVDGKTYKGNAEVKLNAPKNTPDGTNPFECAETSALGRALAFAGMGTVESIASFDEVYRAMQSQDANQRTPAPTAPAPAERKPEQNTQQPTQATTSEPKREPLATEQQVASIRKLCQHTGTSEPEKLQEMAYFAAKELIAQLSAKYKEQRQNANNKPAPVNGAQKALQDMIMRAKVSVDALPGDFQWDIIKRDALDGKPIDDSALTVQQVAEINKLIAFYEKDTKTEKAS